MYANARTCIITMSIHHPMCMYLHMYVLTYEPYGNNIELFVCVCVCARTQTHTCFNTYPTFNYPYAFPKLPNIEFIVS